MEFYLGEVANGIAVACGRLNMKRFGLLARVPVRYLSPTRPTQSRKLFPRISPGPVPLILWVAASNILVRAKCKWAKTIGPDERRVIAIPGPALRQFSFIKTVHRIQIEIQRNFSADRLANAAGLAPMRAPCRRNDTRNTAVSALSV